MTSSQAQKTSIKEKVLSNLGVLFEQIDKEFSVKVTQISDGLNFDIKTILSDTFLANNGHILNDLQHIIRLMTHHQDPDDKTHFTLDMNAFRQKRHESICQRIPEIVSQKVIREGRALVFLGLNSYERHIVHTLLSEVKGVQSFGVGIKNNRRLVIMSSSEIGTSGVDKAEVIKVEQLIG